MADRVVILTADGHDSKLADLDAIAGGSRYQRTFANSDLTLANLLVTPHELGVIPGAHRFFDASGNEWHLTTEESTTASITDFSRIAPITGTWTEVILG